LRRLHYTTFIWRSIPHTLSTAYATTATWRARSNGLLRHRQRAAYTALTHIAGHKRLLLPRFWIARLSRGAATPLVRFRGRRARLGPTTTLPHRAIALATHSLPAARHRARDHRTLLPLPRVLRHYTTARADCCHRTRCRRCACAHCCRVPPHPHTCARAHTHAPATLPLAHHISHHPLTTFFRRMPRTLPLLRAAMARMDGFAHCPAAPAHRHCLRGFTAAGCAPFLPRCAPRTASAPPRYLRVRAFFTHAMDKTPRIALSLLPPCILRDAPIRLLPTRLPISDINRRLQAATPAFAAVHAATTAACLDAVTRQRALLPCCGARPTCDRFGFTNSMQKRLTRRSADACLRSSSRLAHSPPARVTSRMPLFSYAQRTWLRAPLSRTATATSPPPLIACAHCSLA